MANQYLSLSLFIMMLSFFLVLSALSNYEPGRSQPVVRSLQKTFASEIVKEEKGASYQKDVVEMSGEADALDQLEALFKAQITGVKVTQNRLGTIMHVTVPVSDFSQALSSISSTQFTQGSETNPEDVPFLPTLISLMQTGETIPYRMDMVINTNSAPGLMENEQPQNIKRRIDQVGEFARQLESADLPRKMFSIGLGKGERHMMSLYFRRYQPFNALGEKVSLEEETPAQEEPATQQPAAQETPTEEPSTEETQPTEPATLPQIIQEQIP